MKPITIHPGSALAGAAIVVLAPATLGQSVLYTFNGDSADDDFGISVRAAGDVNGDGFADIIVGARQDDNNGTDAGSARVFSGADGSILYTFDGDSAEDSFGRSVGGADDVNGDGFDDLIVGAYGDDNNGTDSGSARVFSGVDGSILYTFDGDSAGDNFGTSVSGAGDVNGDGLDDLIVGANLDDNNGSNSGSARVFSGADGSVLYTFDGDSADDWFGASVSGAGDVDGDGFADLIVGARGDKDSEPGWARVFSGFDGGVLYTFHGDPGAQLGNSVSGAGDVNGDGFDDVIVGAHQTEVNGIYHAGRACVFSGVDGSTLYTFEGDSFDDHFGSSVGGAGDVDGDGYADLIVGAFNDDYNGTDSGSAWIFSGVDGGTLYRFDGDSADDLLGHGVSGADVDGDGYADLMVGAVRGGANDGGYARVFSGCDGCGAIGTNYCVANPNSTGLPASIGAHGSEVIADNDVTLVTTDVAVNQFGFYLMSDTQGFVPLFGGGMGNLCLGGKIYRLNQPPTGEVLFSGPGGVMTFSPDLTILPGGVVLQPGETWNFQLWFRDVVGPIFTHNTSDGLAVTWQ